MFSARITDRFRRLMAMLPGMAVVATLVVTPLTLTDSVQASSNLTLGDTREMSNGVGFVLLVSLRRNQ